MIITDGHAGLRAALTARFPGIAWQRCQFHLQQNAMAYVPRQAERKDVAADLRSVFDAPDDFEARRRLAIIIEKWKEPAPKLAEWMEHSVPQGLTVLRLPLALRRRLRTTNMLERLNKEIKRRVPPSPPSSPTKPPSSASSAPC